MIRARLRDGWSVDGGAGPAATRVSLERTRFSRLVLASFVPLLVAAPVLAASPAIEVTATVPLDKGGGRVDQVAALPGGGYVVRDYSWESPESQVIQRFDGEGRLQGEIAAYGHGAGKYVRLKDLAVAPDGSLWMADFGAARVTHYGMGGEVLDTLLLQNPSYRPSALALGPSAGSLYVAGCVPLKTYLNDGCTMVHRYRTSPRKLEGSYLETPAEAIESGWAGKADYDLDAAADGTVYFIHETLLTLFRLPSGGDAFEAMPVSSAVAKPPPVLDRETATRTGGADALLRSSYALDRVVAAGGLVAVSIRRPGGDGYLLAVFDSNHRQVARDLAAPGRLVGASPGGDWIFVRREERGFVLDLGRLAGR